MQFYASPEQIMRDRSEYARKNMARGRGAVVLSYGGGVLFVAENVTTLHKLSEIYDRIGFAAVGRYNEFENLRAAGVRLADLRGYSYDRRDVTGRALATAYAQTLGAIFSDQTKPFEVEICVAEVGSSPDRDELYRITYDGSVLDEPGLLAMGGQADAMTSVLKAGHSVEMSLPAALRLGVQALASVGGEGGAPRVLTERQLEVAILDRAKSGRAFRRIVGAALASLLNTEAPAGALAPAPPAPEAPAEPEAPVDTATPEAQSDAGTAPAAPGEAGAEQGQPEEPPAQSPPDDETSA